MVAMHFHWLLGKMLVAKEVQMYHPMVARHVLELRRVKPDSVDINMDIPQ